MALAILLYWMWGRGEEDEQLMTLTGVFAFIEAYFEWQLLLWLLGR